MSAESTAAQAPLRIFYLGRWAAFQDTETLTWYWAPEYDLDGWLDLRPVALQSIPPSAGARQCCLFGATEVIIGQPGWTWLAASVNGPLGVSGSTVDTLMGARPGTYTASTLGDLAFELLVEDTSPATGRNPLSPNRNLVWSLAIKGDRIFNEKVEDNPDAWSKVVDRVAADYAQIRAESLQRGDELYLKYLQTQADRYRVDYRQFLGGLPDEGTRKPSTTHTDDFNCTSSDTMGCDLTWAELSGDWDIDSNTYARGHATSSYTRAEHDVSTDDHIVTTTMLGENGDRAGPIARADTTYPSPTYYWCRWEFFGQDIEIFKRVAGSDTNLSDDGFSTASYPTTFSLEVDGSDLECIYDGNSSTATDSAITGNTRGGLWSDRSVAGAWFDDWEISDLGAAPAGRRILIIN